MKIEDADFAKISGFDQYDKILNFYGYQRFGSRRAVSHPIGKAMLQRNFDLAVEVLLSSTSEYDFPENNKIREALKDKANYLKIFDDVPPQMDTERVVLKEMIEHGDALKALRAIPISLRRFFVEAYQSFIFNRTVSMAYEMGENMLAPQADDVCYDRDDNLGRYQNDPEQSRPYLLSGTHIQRETGLTIRYQRYLAKSR